MNSFALPTGGLVPHSARLLRIGEWTVHVALDEISASGELRKLEPRTMRLLLHLADKPGQVVGIQELLHAVWPNVVVTPHSVYATIAELRRALGDSAESPRYIATVARKGYRLVAAVEQLPSPPALGATNPALLQTLNVGAEPAPAPLHADGDLVPSGRGRAPRRTWLIAGGLGLALLAAAIVAVQKHNARLPDAVTAKSIAVLPFVDMSAAKDEEYFADGLAELIVQRLSQVPQLQVAARTSAFSFKGQTLDVPTIAARLRVANVLEGSVQKAGDRLRVTAQLIRASSGYHIWSATYDRQVDDVFDIQDEISIAVAKALKTSLLPATTPLSGTKNVAANDLYLQASFYFGRVSVEGMAKTAALLDKALALDPKFAGAWALLSRVKMSQYRHKLIPDADLAAAYQLARTAAYNAVATDPNLVEGHTALGRVFLFDYISTGDTEPFKQAAAQFQLALELDPHNADTLVQLGIIASMEGRYTETVRLDRMALELDPLNINILEMLGGNYLAVGEYAAAEKVYRQEQNLSPNNMYASTSRARALALLGRAAEALKIIDTDSQLKDQGQQWWRALLYPMLGRSLEADVFYDEVQKHLDRDGYLDMAELDAFHGRTDRAFAWLERAYASDPGALRQYLRADPLLHNLHDDPRFSALEARLKNNGGLPQN